MTEILTRPALRAAHELCLFKDEFVLFTLLGGFTRLEIMETCPFKVGEIVGYTPSRRGRGLVIMTDLAALKPGQKYKIARIDKEVAVVIEGFEDSPGGGLYWTEFTRDE